MTWTREDLLDSLDEFNNLYASRPIKDNTGGMKSAHMFPAWFIAKKLQPKTLIESGVWKGLGTWFFRQACPDAHIICIDPEPRFRENTDPLAVYQTEDFLDTDWDHVEKETALVFLDDHQNAITRLMRCLSLGFNRVIVEDNYPYQQGDCYSPKKVLSGKDYVMDSAGYRTWMPTQENDIKWFSNHVTEYQEMPPIFKGHETRWGDEWGDKYPTPEPLLSELHRASYPTFWEEHLDYTWLCYMELK